VEINLDLVMVLNFLVDFLLLLGVNRLSAYPAQPWRCAGAALLGAVYSGACFLPGFSFLGNILWRMLSLSLMGTIAFGVNPGALKRGGLFLLLSMAMGGIALHIGRENLLSVLLCVLICLLLSIISFGGQTGGREYVPLQIALGDRSASFLALRDTGNTLRDPVTGEPVLVVSASIAGKLTGLTQQQLKNPLETLSARIVPGLRLIPYRSIGTAGGFLLAKRFDNVIIGGKRRSTLVAFAAEGLGNGEIYQALTGGH
jgi:stage II sporulation protein GA (sporulation sigma-E factor processing peptidase)